jgi:thiamine-monophosphate kinase
MSEAAILERIRKLAETRNAAVVRGIGDDCAVVRPNLNTDLVFTTDFLIEDRHFRLAEQSAVAIGHRALARSLSDLAAMGSQPVFCMVSLALAPRLTGRWLSGFYRGLIRLADEFGMALAGGDLSQAEKVVADVMCCGKVPRGKALLRSGARPGDVVYVTGKLGRPWTLRPVPRIAEGISLRRVATAAMDISDGLSLDLRRLCLESGVSAELESAAIPIFRGATLERALHGGEDYELVFTTRPRTRTRFIRVGVIGRGRPGTVLLDGKPLRAGGFDHFRETRS